MQNSEIFPWRRAFFPVPSRTGPPAVLAHPAAAPSRAGTVPAQSAIIGRRSGGHHGPRVRSEELGGLGGSALDPRWGGRPAGLFGGEDEGRAREGLGERGPGD